MEFLAPLRQAGIVKATTPPVNKGLIERYRRDFSLRSRCRAEIIGHHWHWPGRRGRHVDSCRTR